MTKIREFLQRNKNKIKLAGARSVIFVMLFLLPSLTFAITPAQQAQLDAIDQQINTLKDQISQKQGEKVSISNEVSILDSQISGIQLEVSKTQTELGVINNDIANLVVQINQAEVDLATQKSQLSEIVRVMYEDGQISNIELIVKSNSFSEFLNRTEYIETMQLRIRDAVDKINTLKSELERKKKALDDKKIQTEQLKAAQQAQRSAVGSQLSYKNYLLTNAASAEKSLSKQKNDLYARKATLSAQFGETISGGGSGYPYGNPPADNRIDTPDAYGYLIGECTSYSAWKRTAIGRSVPRNLGNANTWGTRAANQGYTVSSIPIVGSVMVFPYLGGYGHVAIVEAVNGDGTVAISEYNWVPYKYSFRAVVNPYNYSAVFIY
jgi:surface antigen